VTTLASRFGVLPLMRVEKVGYGAGRRDLPNMPNLLRLIVGETEDRDVAARRSGDEHHAHEHHHHH
jgi:uncharacterized protein (DUF111 family)